MTTITAFGDDKMKREFNVVIEQDEDGYFVASVPALRGCHTQAKSLDVLMKGLDRGTEGLGKSFVSRGACPKETKYATTPTSAPYSTGDQSTRFLCRVLASLCRHPDRYCDLNGSRRRYWSKIVSALILLAGYLMAAFTGKKQALHDIMSGCLVVQK